MFKPFSFSILCAILTWLLLVVGGLVNPMNASMACPDWYFIPTCNGEFLPEMVGGVLYEHGHRLLASLVGICTLVLAYLCCRETMVDRLTKFISILALALVIVQGSLGGLTVLLNLSAMVSTLHLLCAMVFFSLLIVLSFRLSKDFKPIKVFESSLWPLFIAIVLTLGQLVYGGVVRHMGAGLACGDDLLGCGESLWPSWFYGQLHMGHRLLGYGIFFVVLYASRNTFRKAKQNGDKSLLMLSMVPVFITFCQIALGLLAIYTVRSPSILAMHTGFGALLLASLLASYLLQLTSSTENRTLELLGK